MGSNCGAVAGLGAGELLSGIVLAMYMDRGRSFWLVGIDKIDTDREHLFSLAVDFGCGSCLLSTIHGSI